MLWMVQDHITSRLDVPVRGAQDQHPNLHPRPPLVGSCSLSLRLGYNHELTHRHRFGEAEAWIADNSKLTLALKLDEEVN